MRKSALLLLLTLLSAARLSAQDVQAAIAPDTVRVGDIVAVGVQVLLAPGTELVVPDTLELSGDLENAARKRVRVDSLNDGTLRHIITYPITAWRPGRYPLPEITLSLLHNGVRQTVPVTLPELNVLTVLPPDTAGVEAKPPRDVWGASRLWWPLVLLGLLALALIAALIWWWRRRKRPEEVLPEIVIPAVPPREWALSELERIRQMGLLERGDYRRFYIELSDLLRHYVVKLDGMWSTDLTTGELDSRMRQARAEPGTLVGVLERADLVKFARHQPGRERPLADLDTARKWVETFEKPSLLAEAA